MEGFGFTESLTAVHNPHPNLIDHQNVAISDIVNRLFIAVIAAAVGVIGRCVTAPSNILQNTQTCTIEPLQLDIRWEPRDIDGFLSHHLI